MQGKEEPRLYLCSSSVRRESRWMGRDLCAKHVLVQVKFRREKKPNILSNIFNKARLIILIYPLSSQIKQDDLTLCRIFWSGRKFNQIDVHFVPSLCKLWHKSYIANRTSLHSFSWCMKLTCANALRSDKIIRN